MPPGIAARRTAGIAAGIGRPGSGGRIWRPGAAEPAQLPRTAILPDVSDLISPAGPPAEITHLVRERTEARLRHDWPRADALKAEIEAAGWRVVDRGSRTSVSPAAPASVEVDGEVRYGAASAVPSLLEAPATTGWAVVLVASEQPDRVSRMLTALRSFAPAGTQIVIVANDPSDAQATALAPGALIGWSAARGRGRAAGPTAADRYPSRCE